jgi:hypothetical protein
MKKTVKANHQPQLLPPALAEEHELRVQLEEVLE